MQTILILLDPARLANPDLDLRYRIPDRVEEVTGKAIRDNGYDYIDPEDLGSESGGPFMGIWLAAGDAEAAWPEVLRIFREEQFLDNDLSRSAEIRISREDRAWPADCKKVYPL